MFAEELRYAHCVFAMRAHSPGKGLQSAMHEPAIERRRHRAALILDAANTLKKFVIFVRNERTSEHVAMSAKVFRGRVHDQIGAEPERLLNHGAPGVVDNEARPNTMRDLCDCGDVS